MQVLTDLNSLAIQMRYERLISQRWSLYTSGELRFSLRPRFQLGGIWDAIRNEKRTTFLRLGIGPSLMTGQSIFYDPPSTVSRKENGPELNIQFFAVMEYYFQPQFSIYAQVNGSRYIETGAYDNVTRNPIIWRPISNVAIGANFHF